METKLGDLQKSQKEVCPMILHREVLDYKQPVGGEPIFLHQTQANCVLICMQSGHRQMHLATTQKT